MKKCFILFFLFGALSSNAQVMIFELYAHGGNSGARYDNDFVVLYNSGGSAQSLNGYSLQYESAAGSTWAKYDFSASASIPAGGYFLVIATTSGLEGAAVPTTSLTPTGAQQLGATIGSFGMSGFSTTGGKLALMNTTTLLTSATPVTTPIPASTGIVDFLGYGSSASDSETSPALTPTVASVIYRENGTDTNNNSTDFDRNTNNSLSLSNGSFAVNYTSFGGKAKTDAISLNWQTSSETNNQGFEVQKSRNAVSFETIARIDGAGDSQDLNSYNFTDEQPFTGSNYYRLKQTDFDGAEDFSKIIQVYYEVNGSYVSLHPNPLSAGQALNIQKSESLELNSIRNVMGQNFQTSSNLKEGLYFLQFTSSNGEKITKKLVVN